MGFTGVSAACAVVQNQGLVDKLGAERDRGEVVKGQTSYLSVIL